MNALLTLKKQFKEENGFNIGQVKDKIDQLIADAQTERENVKVCKRMVKKVPGELLGLYKDVVLWNPHYEMLDDVDDVRGGRAAEEQIHAKLNSVEMADEVREEIHKAMVSRKAHADFYVKYRPLVDLSTFVKDPLNGVEAFEEVINSLKIFRKCMKTLLNYEFWQLVKCTSEYEARDGMRGIFERNTLHGPRYVYRGVPWIATTKEITRLCKLNYSDSDWVSSLSFIGELLERYKNLPLARVLSEFTGTVFHKHANDKMLSIKVDSGDVKTTIRLQY